MLKFALLKDGISPFPNRRCGAKKGRWRFQWLEHRWLRSVWDTQVLPTVTDCSKRQTKMVRFTNDPLFVPQKCCVMPYYWTRTSLFWDIFGWYLVGIWLVFGGIKMHHPSELRSRIRHLERQGLQGHVHKAGPIRPPGSIFGGEGWSLLVAYTLTLLQWTSMNKDFF